ncbi:mannonate dehydratase [Novosphingobium humi]|uniref:mannonate dehydratase n=1 Tax=Novosphingobium humi TaxID=2282397 RepID=UPI0025B16BA3|nr:mannonate dehydratase [Novosphingobium humi]WJT00472.1 mannonate dehydratase [Novosphingobium humi]
MERRDFLTTIGAGIGATALTGAAPPMAQAAGRRSAAPKRPALKMKLGCQSGPASDDHFAFLARYGVTHVAARAKSAEGALYSTADEVKALRDLAEKHKLTLSILDPLLLPSSHIDREKNPGIMLATSPEREREVEAFQNQIRACAAAGVPCIKYNMSLLGVIRTGRVQGRGDAVFSEYDAARLDPAKPLTRAGMVGEDAFWERITWFLDHVVPVANEYKIRIACHPHDPGTPPQGYQGIHRVLGTIEGMKRFISIRESAYHGLNFCQGTVSENLPHPAEQIFDVIRYFGSRKKIFNVHFRNIVGGRGHFREAFPDEGDVDLYRALLTYAEVGYDGMLMPDHVPIIPGHPEAQGESFAFAYGHIRGLMQAAQHYSG